jgi:hypothetical protein
MTEAYGMEVAHVPGSTAQHILLDASCPVLAVKAED